MNGRTDRSAERLIGVIALANLLAGLIFLASLMLAATAITAAAYECAGDDLVERLAREKPERLVARRAEAAAIENGRSLFWRVTSTGKPDSWLFGTMHSADPRIARLPPNVGRAFAAADTVLIENVEALDPAKMTTAMVKLREYTLLENGTTLDSLIRADNADRLRSEVEKRSLPWAVAQKMQPWMIAATISIPVCDLKARQSGGPVLDQLIGQMALEGGKRLQGLETIEEQFEAVHGIDREFQIDALDETLMLGPLAEDLMETTKLLYLEDNVAMMLPLVREFAPKTYAAKGYAEFQQRLITTRNRTMAQRAIAYLEAGNAFIAVGALHLPGEEGLVNLLRNQGFEVVPLETGKR